MPRTTCFAWIALATGLAVAAGCGDAATSTTDAGDDHADGTAETPDATPEADAPTDVTVPDELPDEPAEVPDVEPDAAPDGPADVEPDAAPDGPADVEPDAAPDGPADAPADEPTDGEAGPGEVRVTMTDSDAWANLMPGGSSYHATFTLEVDNRSATDVTGFSVADGAVSLLSGAATLFRFTRPALTLAGGGPFDGRVAAGTTVRLEGNGMSAPASSGHCGAEVKVQVRVAWTGGPSTREVSGDTITLDCVY